MVLPLGDGFGPKKNSCGTQAVAGVISRLFNGRFRANSIALDDCFISTTSPAGLSTAFPWLHSLGFLFLNGCRIIFLGKSRRWSSPETAS